MYRKYARFNSFSAQTIFRHQNLTSKDGPRSEIIKIFIMAIQYCAIKTGRGEGEMKWKGMRIHVSRQIPFHFFSQEFSR